MKEITDIRIPEEQLQVIRECFIKSFGKEDALWVFGSRVDMSKRGGDLDLYIETHEKDIDMALERKFLFVNSLWKSLGEQKIDVILNILQLHSSLPIYDIAKSTGVRLI